jgi:hypothetical protein
MPHLESIIESLKVVWVKRYSTNNYHPWKEFLIEGLKNTGSHNIFNRKIPNNIIEMSELSQFNKELIISWNKVQKFPTEPDEIANQYLWVNEYISKPNKEIIHYQELAKCGINQVKDLVKDEKIITINNINLDETCWKRKFELSSILQCLPRSWKIVNFDAPTTDTIRYTKKWKRI